MFFIGVLFCIHSYAQDFMSKDMEKYLSYCLESRKLIKEKKCDKLLLYADSISRLAINELDESDFISLQPSKEVRLDGHVIFTDCGLIVVVESIINENSAKYNLHNINRGNEIYLAHRVIPAKSKMRYQIICADSLDMLIFPETTGNITTKIISEEGSTLADCNIRVEQGWGKISFNVGEIPCSVIIELTNKENEDICCAFAINGQ